MKKLLQFFRPLTYNVCVFVQCMYKETRVWNKEINYLKKSKCLVIKIWQQNKRMITFFRLIFHRRRFFFYDSAFGHDFPSARSIPPLRGDKDPRSLTDTGHHRVTESQSHRGSGGGAERMSETCGRCWMEEEIVEGMKSRDWGVGGGTEGIHCEVKAINHFMFQ